MLEQLVTSEVEGILMWACLIEGLYQHLCRGSRENRENMAGLPVLWQSLKSGTPWVCPSQIIFKL